MASKSRCPPDYFPELHTGVCEHCSHLCLVAYGTLQECNFHCPDYQMRLSSTLRMLSTTTTAPSAKTTDRPPAINGGLIVAIIVVLAILVLISLAAVTLFVRSKTKGKQNDNRTPNVVSKPTMSANVHLCGNMGRHTIPQTVSSCCSKLMHILRTNSTRSITEYVKPLISRGGCVKGRSLAKDKPEIARLMPSTAHPPGGLDCMSPVGDNRPPLFKPLLSSEPSRRIPDCLVKTRSARSTKTRDDKSANTELETGSDNSNSSLLLRSIDRQICHDGLPVIEQLNGQYICDLKQGSRGSSKLNHISTTRRDHGENNVRKAKSNGIAVSDGTHDQADQSYSASHSAKGERFVIQIERDGNVTSLPRRDDVVAAKGMVTVEGNQTSPKHAHGAETVRQWSSNQTTWSLHSLDGTLRQHEQEGHHPNCQHRSDCVHSLRQTARNVNVAEVSRFESLSIDLRLNSDVRPGEAPPPTEDSGSYYDSIPDDRWNIIIKLYELVNNQLYKYPWIVGCLISNEVLEIVINLDNVNLTIEGAYDKLCEDIPIALRQYLVFSKEGSDLTAS